MKHRLYGTFGSLLLLLWGFRLKEQGIKRLAAAIRVLFSLAQQLSGDELVTFSQCLP
jgi:hypothetical protein